MDNQVFSDSEGTLAKQVKNVRDNNIKIILVHETDRARGGVIFDNFFQQTPRELLIPPYKLYSDIAIELYTFEKYRDISLQSILCKIRDLSAE